MAEEFVSKEVFNARMDRMEAIMEKEISELKSEIKATNERMEQGFALINERMEKNLAEYKAIALETRGEVRALAAHIQSLEYWGAIIIGAATIAFGLAQYFQNKRETIAAEVKEQVNELRKTVLALVEASKIAAPR